MGLTVLVQFLVYLSKQMSSLFSMPVIGFRYLRNHSTTWCLRCRQEIYNDSIFYFLLLWYFSTGISYIFFHFKNRSSLGNFYRFLWPDFELAISLANLFTCNYLLPSICINLSSYSAEYYWQLRLAAQQILRHNRLKIQIIN